MIQLTASRATLTAQLPRETLTVGMRDAVFCYVTFEDAWDSLTKIAVFSNGQRSVDVPETDWDGNTFPVPAEVLMTPGLNVRLGLYGTDGETVILPTVWCSLGTVRDGAAPSQDTALDPQSPLWERVLAKQTALEQTYKDSITPYTTLTRGNGKVRIHIHNLVDGEQYALHLYTTNRKNGRRQKAWIHPPNFDRDDITNFTRKGYWRLAGGPAGGTSSYYPQTPAWMPHNGRLQTEWQLESGANTLEIDLKHWLLPMLKPIDPAADNPWLDCGLIGLGRYDGAALLFQWRIVRLRDGAVGECKNTLKAGVPSDMVPAELIKQAGYINALYTAIV